MKYDIDSLNKKLNDINSERDILNDNLKQTIDNISDLDAVLNNSFFIKFDDTYKIKKYDLSSSGKIIKSNLDLKKPYNNQDNIIDYQSPSSDNNYQTFCGT